MATDKGLVSKASLTAIGDAIREKNKTTTQYKLSEMAQAIKDIEGGEIVVTTGDKYTLKIIQPSKGTITSSLVGKVINNSDGTVSAGVTDNSTYTPYTGYDPGVILRSFDKDSGVFTVTGTGASPTSVVDNKGFARMYMRVSTIPSLYTDSEFSEYRTNLTNASGKIFIAGLMSSVSYINVGYNVTAYFDPIVTTQYAGLGMFSSSLQGLLEYLSTPRMNISDTNWYLSNTKLKYFDMGSPINIELLQTPNTLESLVIRTTDTTLFPDSFSPSGKINNLYVPEAVLSSYQNHTGWKSAIINFVALEGSKYEDPYGFLNEISS